MLKIVLWIECSEEQHLFEIEICKMINVFTVTFDQNNYEIKVNLFQSEKQSLLL